MLKFLVSEEGLSHSLERLEQILRQNTNISKTIDPIIVLRRSFNA